VKRKTIFACVSFSLIGLFMVIFFWLASVAPDPTSRQGYTAIAASFVIALISVVDKLLEKGDSALQYSAEQLTEPLKKISANLSYSSRMMVEVKSIFQREIVNSNLLGLLEAESPKLAKNLQAVAPLVDELRVGAAINGAGREAELFLRLEGDKRANDLRAEIQADIEVLFAKFGGH
jgi:hypothetical protein